MCNLGIKKEKLAERRENRTIGVDYVVRGVTLVIKKEIVDDRRGINLLEI